METSKLLNTGLDAETLAICVRLCEKGVNPEALAMVIQELRRETTALNASEVRVCHAENISIYISFDRKKQFIHFGKL